MTSVDSASLLVEGPWRHQFVPANGQRFHVTLAGPDDRDAPLVVLLHGTPQFWWAWRAQIPLLADAGYRVAAMDVRGSGASDKPPHGYDVPTLTRDVAGVIRSLGAADAVVIGSGTGGEIAWGMPALQPEVTRAIGVLGAPHPLDASDDVRAAVRPAGLGLLAYAQLPALPERAMLRSDLVERFLTGWGAPGWLTPAVAATYRRAAQVPFAAHSQMEQLRWLVRSVPRPDGRRFRSALRDAAPVPVLHVHGAQDGLRPAARAALRPQTAQKVASTYRFELVAESGHYLSEESPEHVGALLVSWLGEVAPV